MNEHRRNLFQETVKKVHEIEGRKLNLELRREKRDEEKRLSEEKKRESIEKTQEKIDEKKEKIKKLERQIEVAVLEIIKGAKKGVEDLSLHKLVKDNKEKIEKLKLNIIAFENDKMKIESTLDVVYSEIDNEIQNKEKELEKINNQIKDQQENLEVADPPKTDDEKKHGRIKSAFLNADLSGFLDVGVAHADAAIHNTLNGELPKALYNIPKLLIEKSTIIRELDYLSWRKEVQENKTPSWLDVASTAFNSVRIGRLERQSSKYANSWNFSKAESQKEVADFLESIKDAKNKGERVVALNIIAKAAKKAKSIGEISRVAIIYGKMLKKEKIDKTTGKEVAKQLLEKLNKNIENNLTHSLKDVNIIDLDSLSDTIDSFKNYKDRDQLIKSYVKLSEQMIEKYKKDSQPEIALLYKKRLEKFKKRHDL